MLGNLVIFGRSFSPYMLCCLLGLLTAGLYSCLQAKQHGLDEVAYLTSCLWGALGAFLGMHLLYGITELDSLILIFKNFRKLWEEGSFFHLFFTAFSGSVFYGGMLGFLSVTFLVARRRKRPVAAYLDHLASAIPLFHTFGRIGCFLSGCCYGVESGFGFVYQHALVEQANGVRRLPVQLIEAAANLLVFLLCFLLQKKKRLEGRLIYVYLLFYSGVRFVLEFFRGDSYRGFLFGLSTSQLISIPLFLTAAVLLLVSGRLRAKKKAEAAACTLPS